MLTGEFPASATLLHGQSIVGREMRLSIFPRHAHSRQKTHPGERGPPWTMKNPMVEKTAGLVAEYGTGDIEEMWRVRDAQCRMGHMGDAWDVAYACLYLASDESIYVTGLKLIVEGGISLKLS